jgi:hypothetical protein
MAISLIVKKYVPPAPPTPFLGDQVTFTNAEFVMYGHQTGTMLSGNKFLCTFRDQTPTNEVYVVGTISGETATFSEPAFFTASPVSVNYKPMLYYDPTYNKVILFAGLGYYVGSVSGDTVSFGSINNYFPTFTIDSYYYAVYTPSEHRVVIAYRSGSTIRAIAGVFDGSTISFGSSISVYSNAIVGVSVCQGPSSDEYCLVFNPDGGTSRITMLETSGTTITSPYSVYSVLTSCRFNPACHYAPSRDLFFVTVYNSVTYNTRKNILFAYSYSEGVFTKLHSLNLTPDNSNFPNIDYDAYTDKVLVDINTGGSTADIKLYTYNESTGFAYDSNIVFLNAVEYNNSVLLYQPSTGKRVVLYGITTGYVGAARVFRV